MATEYVDEGMMRFVRAQYAQALPFGAMLGYVMDGDVPFALRSVKQRIHKNAPALHCEENLPKDFEPLGKFHSFFTKHQRTSCEIELHHFMLPIKQVAIF